MTEFRPAEWVGVQGDRPFTRDGRRSVHRVPMAGDSALQVIDARSAFVDLTYLDQPGLIATAVLHGPGGVTLVDPGPGCSLAFLKRSLTSAGIPIADVTELLITHVHLDHAGAAGEIVRENANIRVLVHPRGARHLIDPSKLLQSARSIYGTNLERLWGDVVPVPRANVVALDDRSRITLAGRALDVIYTPGHANHHVSYLDRSTETLYAGDVAGVRINGGIVLPPTPPPDIDLEAWHASLDSILALAPAQLFLPHFGIASHVQDQIAQLRSRLISWASLVRTSLSIDSFDDADRARLFIAEVERELNASVSTHEIQRYTWAAGAEASWYGLARYWRAHGDT